MLPLNVEMHFPMDQAAHSSYPFICTVFFHVFLKLGKIMSSFFSAKNECLFQRILYLSIKDKWTSPTFENTFDCLPSLIILPFCFILFSIKKKQIYVNIPNLTSFFQFHLLNISHPAIISHTENLSMAHCQCHAT